ncbi:ComF family protein [Parvularcula flava]|uniref:ComF family protein n=2 Tax=Aquisalinus luteolus TaxID=1566827 RepID=A0ABX0HHD5_9PROT|nr:ComF family protein [Aquisalinus luteolus]
MPPQCLLTGEPVGNHGDLSANVWQQLHFIAAPMCSACGLPWEAQVAGQDLCAACIAGEEHPGAIVFDKGLDHVRCALRYDDLSAQLALRLKYADRLDMAGGLSRLIVQAGRDVLTDGALVVPVPLHRTRLISRRYNQAGVLASAISKACGLDLCLDLLHRQRATPRQQGLSAKGRERNVRGAFRVTPRHRDLVKGAHVVLIDDVLTTGSTLKACARVLKRAGAERVDALVLARVVPEGIGAI